MGMASTTRTLLSRSRLRPPARVCATTTTRTRWSRTPTTRTTVMVRPGTRLTSAMAPTRWPTLTTPTTVTKVTTSATVTSLTLVLMPSAEDSAPEMPVTTLPPDTETDTDTDIIKYCCCFRLN